MLKKTRARQSQLQAIEMSPPKPSHGWVAAVHWNQCAQQAVGRTRESRAVARLGGRRLRLRGE